MVAVAVAGDAVMLWAWNFHQLNNQPSVTYETYAHNSHNDVLNE